MTLKDFLYNFTLVKGNFNMLKEPFVMSLLNFVRTWNTRTGLTEKSKSIEELANQLGKKKRKVKRNYGIKPRIKEKRKRNKQRERKRL